MKLLLESLLPCHSLLLHLFQPFLLGQFFFLLLPLNFLSDFFLLFLFLLFLSLFQQSDSFFPLLVLNLLFLDSLLPFPFLLLLLFSLLFFLLFILAD